MCMCVCVYGWWGGVDSGLTLLALSEWRVSDALKENLSLWSAVKSRCQPSRTARFRDPAADAPGEPGPQPGTAIRLTDKDSSRSFTRRTGEFTLKGLGRKKRREPV